MLQRFPCPVCSNDRWRGLRSHSYGAADHLRPGSRLTEYQRLRRRILFEVWFPGRDEVTLRSVVCTECGFVTFTPRPGGEDVAAKYRFLAVAEPNIGGSGGARAERMDRSRAEQTHRIVAGTIGAAPRRVLDFGGGNGKLLRPFLEAGSDCSIVDYNPRPIPGVRWLGETLDLMPAGSEFDAVICSHVLEHLADPAEALGRLAPLLSAEGVLFSEVPVEIWRDIPIDRDPVTHLNFFTAATLQELHLAAGLKVVLCEELSGNYGEFRKEVAVVVARRNGAGGNRRGSALEETMRRIDPPLRDRIARAWRSRRLASPRRLAARVRRAVPRSG